VPDDKRFHIPAPAIITTTAAAPIKLGLDFRAGRFRVMVADATEAVDDWESSSCGGASGESYAVSCGCSYATPTVCWDSAGISTRGSSTGSGSGAGNTNACAQAGHLAVRPAYSSLVFTRLPQEGQIARIISILFYSLLGI
jgi:hypothetical protein